jgi:hypothetical protein
MLMAYVKAELEAEGKEILKVDDGSNEEIESIARYSQKGSRLHSQRAPASDVMPPSDVAHWAVKSSTDFTS